MENNTETNERIDGTTIENNDSNSQYIAAIKELKDNSVSKQAYSKLQEENKMLLDSLINGNQIDVGQSPAMSRDEMIAERERLRKISCDPKTDLEWFEAQLKNREITLALGEGDVFIKKEHRRNPSADEVELAERAAKVYQECIDYADGDNQLFIQELQRHTIG